MSSDCAARAARRAWRSSLPAHVIDGASEDVSIALARDEDQFFGDEFDIDVESVAVPSPAVKRPCLRDTWSDSPSHDDSNEPDSEDNKSDDSESEAGSATQMSDDGLAKFSTGCGCTENHFVKLGVEDYKKIQQELFNGASSHARDAYLLGVLGSGRSTSQETRAGGRTRQSFMYQVHGQAV